MQSSDVIVIDIGSRSICAYAAERLSDDAFSVISTCEIEYDGYSEGKWIRPDSILPSLYKLLDKLERSVGKIKTVYVGIPADFCVVRTIYDKVSFPKAKRITAQDIAEIYDENDPYRDGSRERISVEIVSAFDDKGERLRDPIGRVTSCLRTHVSYVGAESDILSSLRAGLLRHGVKGVRFLPSEFAAARALFSAEELESGVLLADVGYTVTSILHLSGNALVEMRTFALGGSMIPEGLTARYDLPFRVASALVPKINLGYKDEGDYSLKYDATTYVCPIGEVNEMTKECVDCLALYLDRSIDSFKYEIPFGATLYVTGGGLGDVRFAREHLAKTLRRKVEFVHPTTPNFAKPYYSTAVGLIREAMALEKKEKFGFLKKLLKV